MAKLCLFFAVLVVLGGSVADSLNHFSCALNNTTALDMIYSGHLINNTKIDGDLVINPSKLNSTKDIIIVNSLINGNFKMSDINLIGDVNFSNTSFNGIIKFERDRFGGETLFIKSKLFDDVILKDSIFSMDVDFKKSVLNGSISMDNISFLKDVTFKEVQFNKDVWLTGIKFFGEYAIFDSSCFLQNAVFQDVTSKSIFFKYVTFSDLCELKDCTFSESYFDKCNFIGKNTKISSKFNGKTIFENANFFGNVSFRSSAFDKGQIDFSGANFSGYSADFSQVDFSGNTIMDNISFAAVQDKSLILNDSSISCLHIKWDQIKDHLRYNGPAYLALVKNFKELEKFEDADGCYYEYRRQKMLDPSRDFFSWILDFISLVTCGYGVRLSNTIGLSMLWILIFTLLFYRHEIFRDALLFSFITFLQLPRSDKYNEMIKRHEYAIIIEQILGWCMMALFIVVLTRKLIIS